MNHWCLLIIYSIIRCLEETHQAVCMLRSQLLISQWTTFPIETPFDTWTRASTRCPMGPSKTKAASHWAGKEKETLPWGIGFKRYGDWGGGEWQEWSSVPSLYSDGNWSSTTTTSSCIIGLNILKRYHIIASNSCGILARPFQRIIIRVKIFEKLFIPTNESSASFIIVIVNHLIIIVNRMENKALHFCHADSSRWEQT